MLRVLATDNLSTEGLEVLKGAEGLNVDVKPPLERSVLLEEIKNYEAVIVRSATKLDAEVLDAASNLQIVIRAGIGVDNIDVARATERGILVANTPHGNSATTAEHAFALIVSLARHVPQACASMKAGKWEKKKFVGTELRGKTLGVVGLGNIGAQVARIGRGYQMEVVAADPFLTPEIAEQHGVEKVELDELLTRSDVITLHCPLNDQTRGLIGRAQLEKMKPTALVINCARGGIVDEEALAEALDAGRIRGAAADVYLSEPPPGDHLLVRNERVVVTPHLGASTKEAQVNVAVEAAQLLMEYVRQGTVSTAINSRLRLSGEISPAARAAVRLARRLGSLHGQLVEHAPKRFEVEIFSQYGAKYQELLLLSAAEAFFQRIFSKDRINHVNVTQYAESRGIGLVSSVITAEGPDPEGHPNWIRVTMTSEGPGGRTISRTAAGTVYSPRNIRIIEIDGYELDLVPTGHLLLITNEDRPGVIGKIGTFLGEHGVNISRMSVNLAPEAKLALGVYRVDSQVPEAAMKEMAAWEAIQSVRYVEL
jgi:D-3-phosphoglycerate dehydrogenase